MRLIFITLAMLMSFSIVHAEQHAADEPSQVEAKPSNMDQLVEQIHRRNLIHQQELLELDRKLKEFEKKREIAKVLKETLDTGVVDEYGNLKSPESSNLLGEDTLLSVPSATVPSGSYAPQSTPSLQLGDPSTAPSTGYDSIGQSREAATVPKLRAVKDNRAYFTMSKGQVVSGAVGDELPGGFEIKAISLNRVLLERDGVQYIATQRWRSFPALSKD